MTTTVKIFVNGRYRATVKQSGCEPVIVEGNYEGSINPGGERSFSLPHPAAATFEISEEAVPETPVGPAAVDPAATAKPDETLKPAQ